MSNENAAQFIAEIGLDPRLVKTSSIQITANNDRGILKCAMYILNSDRSPKRTEAGHPMATTEVRVLTAKEISKARELGLQVTEHKHQWQEADALEYGPTGRVTIYQCTVCGEKKYHDHTPKRGN